MLTLCLAAGKLTQHIHEQQDVLAKFIVVTALPSLKNWTTKFSTLLTPPELLRHGGFLLFQCYSELMLNEFFPHRTLLKGMETQTPSVVCPSIDQFANTPLNFTSSSFSFTQLFPHQSVIHQSTLMPRISTVEPSSNTYD